MRKRILAALAAPGVASACAGCFGVGVYRMPSQSMEPTMRIGSTFTTTSIGSNLKVGAVVTFHPPVGYTHCGDPQQGFAGNASPQPCDRALGAEDVQLTFVKRVVGLPGDSLKFTGGAVYRNGTKEAAPYAEPCNGMPACNFAKAITVPAGQYYVVGDNRPDSEDSRYFGPVPKSWITGQLMWCSGGSQYCTHG